MSDMIQLTGRALTYGFVFAVGGLVSLTARDFASRQQAPPISRSQAETAMQPAMEPESSVSSLIPLREAEENPLIGVIAPVESIDLVASGAGRLEAMNVELGDLVTKGRLLVEVSLEDLDYRHLAQSARLREAEVAIEKAALEVELSRRRWSRRQAAEDVFSVEAREEAELELDAATLDLEAARARRADVKAELDLINERLAGRNILAPFDGQVTTRYVDLGATVSAGQPVLQVVPTSVRVVQFAVPADEAERYGVGTWVGVRLAEADIESCAAIDRVSPALDKGSRFLFMAARLKGDRLRGQPFGTTVEVELAEAIDCV